MEHRATARVLGCLNADTIRVVLSPGQGLADGGIAVELALDLVPHDLRVPNSRFVVVYRGCQIVAVERLAGEG
jgi:hypothetical protein